MSVYEKILQWSENRPLWQRDALRRLAAQDKLAESDKSELVELCIGEQGLPCSKTAVPLSAAHLPQQSTGNGTVRLVKLHSAQNVNALVQGQELSFSRKGLNVIYGDNGSGKSSYARIIKRLCRARGSQERDVICPNVFQQGQETAQPSAVLDFSVDDQNASESWTEGYTTNTALSQVSVFDCHTASAYVEEDMNVAYTPAGLDLLPKLVRACDEVKGSLQAKSDAEKRATPRLPDVPQGTAVAELFSRLTAQTKEQAIRDLAGLTVEEAERLEKAKIELAKVVSEDPRKQAQSLTEQARRYSDYAARLAKVFRALRDEALGTLRSFQQDADNKKKAAELASVQAFTSEPLQGIGTEVWAALWEAARQYSVQQAYPGAEFPQVGDGSRCVLCQQELSPEARTRARRFEEFVKSTASEEADRAVKTIQDALRLLQTLVVRQDADSILLEEISKNDPDLANRLSSFLDSAEKRKQIALNIPKEVIPPEEPTFSVDISNELVQLAEKLKADASNLDPTQYEKLKAELQKAINELAAKKTLGDNLETVLQHLKSLRLQAALQKCIGATRTTEITKFNAELTKETVTDALCQAFDRELQTISPVPLAVTLQEKRGEKGVMFFKLALKDALDNGIGAARILSEGEYRAVALAAFLSELTLNANPSAIVFDDPVSSLDHVRRESVAKRLVEEAKARQVNVFTHDIVFLLALWERADDAGMPCTPINVERRGSEAGCCKQGLPWAGMKIKERIVALKDMLPRLKTLHSNGEQTVYEREASCFYGSLREAWERAIEEVFLNEAILRFKLSIETKRLRVLADIKEEDYKTIEFNMEKASGYLIGHDRSSYSGRKTLPPPNELEADLGALETWVKAIRKRRQ